MNDTNKTLYGTGWSFPPAFTAQGPVMVLDDEEDIRQSLQILFRTQPGERIMRNDYGCDLASAVFEPISEDLLADLTSRINESILRYEQRVVVESLVLKRRPQQHSELSICLSYRIRGTSESQRMSGQLDLGDGRTRSLA